MQGQKSWTGGLSCAHLRTLIEEAPEFIIVCDLDGRIDYINHVVAGVDPETVVGTSAYAWVPPEEAEAMRERIQRISKGGPPEAYEARGKGNNGQRAWYSSRMSLLSWPDVGARIVIITHDISEQKALKEQLELADRLITMGTLVATLGHELNNPLSCVLANVQLLRSAIAKGTRLEGAELAEICNDALEGTMRMRELISDLRDHGTARHGVAGTLDPSEVMESMIRLTSNEIRHRAALVHSYEPGVRVCGSASRLGQLLLNLLVNAAQSIPEGQVHRNVIRVGIRRFDDVRLAIEVSDTGAGMQPAIKEQIFEPFFTTKERGMGVGLSLCRKIALEMGGSIEVESELGKGSTFRVLLPALQSDNTREADEQPSATADALAMLDWESRRVLVIDDEAPLRRALQRVLRGHEVVCAASGREALEVLRTDDRFDLVLCDLMMPEVSGPEFYRAVRELHPALVPRMVFMTGGAFSPESARFVASAEIRVIEKPTDADELRSLVASAPRL